jgi:hypothetical protein
MRRCLTAIVAGLCLAGVAGCVSLRVPSMTQMLKRDEPVVCPRDVAVVWTTVVLSQQAKAGTRGFGGVVTFYADRDKRSVRVDGELTVYAYEESSHATERPSPDRKYVFRREQLEKHYGSGPTGPAYHIWIPWDEAGGPRREVSLVLRFDPAASTDDGKTPDRVVIARPSHVVLPGPTDARDRLEITRGAKAPEILAGPNLPQAQGCASADAPTRMETVTLDLPPGAVARRVNPAAGAVPSSQPAVAASRAAAK